MTQGVHGYNHFPTAHVRSLSSGCPKRFVILTNGREDSGYIDCLKPAFLNTDTIPTEKPLAKENYTH
ncbi:hypothetical protein HPB50_004757 [Hyalomma asiaticum]|uniref:Uncharacterized protein n=1 Tax=Hyalomma asiaticum TaxID=266040 RepID=A0ACB7S3F2_HYAAI|nr:hypothetical protein HPB50_004757 [Hyalomma asiaticum]